jgi:hypothetical protein
VNAFHRATSHILEEVHAMTHRAPHIRGVALIHVLAAVAALVALATPARADTITVTFNSDTLGIKPNGFVSVDSNLVSFSNSDPADPTTPGSQIIIENLNGNGTNDLAFHGSKFLLMHFTTPVTSLSLSFGNDEPSDTHPGDSAVLTALLGGSFVGSTSVAFNRNDLLDQTIGFSGGTFDDALFVFAQGASGSPIPFLAEIIDDVTFTPTPEPAAFQLIAIGAAVVVGAYRRRLFAHS